MNNVSQPSIEAAIKQYSDPYLQQDLLAAKAVKNIQIRNYVSSLNEIATIRAMIMAVPENSGL